MKLSPDTCKIKPPGAAPTNPELSLDFAFDRVLPFDPFLRDSDSILGSKAETD